MQISFGIYRRKLIFFALAFVALGAIFYFLYNQFSYASINDVAVPSYSGHYSIDVNINKNGKVLVNGTAQNRLLSMGKNSDELRYIAADKEGIYINQLDIFIHLPEAIDTSKISQNIYAVHGVEAYDYRIVDSQTLLFTGYNLSPASTFTIVAELPKGIVNFSFWQKALFYLTNIPGWAWLAISIILPVIALLVLLIMFSQKIADWKKQKPKEILKSPPNDLTPAEAEVLMEGKVSARSIAATLLDLASRNYIQISSHGKNFTFIKKKSIDMTGSNQDLKPFEKILLSKIFNENELESTAQDIQVRIGRHIFSRKIAEVYLEIYESISKKGYFLENPSRVHARFHLAGLIFFFIGLAGFIFGIFLAPDPKFYLLFWVGMIASALIIIRLSGELPIRTQSGQNAVYQLLKFKNYLTDSSPIDYSGGVQEIFEKYLPYAVSMRAETEWANRFLEHPFHSPDWYNSTKSVVILEDFVNGIFPVIGFVAKELAASREPIV